MFTAQNLGNFDFLEFPSQSSLLGEDEISLDSLVQDDGFEMPAVGKVCVNCHLNLVVRRKNMDPLANRQQVDLSLK
jgi:hypothetical protein